MYEALIVIVFYKKKKTKQKQKHTHNNVQGHEFWQVDLLSNINNIYSSTR